METFIRSIASLLKMRRSLACEKCGEGWSNQNWLKEPEERLAAGGRRTNEETGLGFVGNRAGLILRRGSAYRHQNNNGRSDRNRRRRVHDDAERALIRISLIRMEMGDLDKRQQRQQSHAQQRHRHADAGAVAALAAAKM
jgi:hypothetical protein